jgi:hypothetical protein
MPHYSEIPLLILQQWRLDHAVRIAERRCLLLRGAIRPRNTRIKTSIPNNLTNKEDFRNHHRRLNPRPQDQLLHKEAEKNGRTQAKLMNLEPVQMQLLEANNKEGETMASSLVGMVAILSLRRCTSNQALELTKGNLLQSQHQVMVNRR